MKIDQLIKYLQCPYCQDPNLVIDNDKIVCVSCDTKYDIIENIPVLIDKEKLNKQEREQTVWFDNHYSEFSKVEYKIERWRQSMLKRVLDQEYKNKIQNYLDIGCGATGYTVIESAKRNGWISFGTDISVEAMVRAKNLAEKQGVSEKTAFVVCAAENMPFKKNIFDYISAISVLEHLKYDNKAIKNIIYALKPGGYIYICVPNSYRRMWPFLWPVYYYNDLKIGHERHYSIDQLDNYFVDKYKCRKNKTFYNGHLIKFYQLGREKLKLIGDKKWWEIERKDISSDNSGVQLNAIYQKKPSETATKKVLLINPPLFFSDGYPQSLDVSIPPLGVLYLASYINHYSESIKAEILDIGAEKISLVDLEEKIKDDKPDVIGISSMTPQLQGTLEVAKLIKKICPDTTVFLGGPHISADKDFIIRHSGLFDYAITGEAEKTFLKTLEKFFKGEAIPRIQESEVVLDLDEIPIPDMTLISRKNYKKTASMLFSRGCPFKCYYCSRPAISKKVRYRSTENMLAEIKERYQDCGGYINFQDDTFTMNRQKVVEFCDAVLKNNLRLQWECNTRIDLVDDELLGKMKQAGCAQINFGIESGNERVRKDIICKGSFNNEKIREIFSLCRKNKIKIAAYFMIGHPTETEGELQETKQMILGYGIDILGLSIPLPFPGSALYEIAKKEGQIDETFIDNFAGKRLGEGYSGIYPTYKSDKLSAEYVLEEMKYINRKFYINFKTFFSRFLQDISSIKKLKSDALELVSLIIKGASTRKPYIKK
ncbi:MAG: radical SAM protein [Parcubacteria group bacterium]|jgi:radical SAM superfamily enzyme YgiQ (UPF0313 family)/ubiquinone/menaquinone biosynthesis C-methylase UbiE